jgi:hypothetical protein
LASGKKVQGQFVGLLTTLMAIHRNIDSSSKLAFLEWYPQTIMPCNQTFLPNFSFKKKSLIKRNTMEFEKEKFHHKK